MILFTTFLALGKIPSSPPAQAFPTFTCKLFYLTFFLSVYFSVEFLIHLQISHS